MQMEQISERMVTMQREIEEIYKDYRIIMGMINYLYKKMKTSGENIKKKNIATKVRRLREKLQQSRKKINITNKKLAQQHVKYTKLMRQTTASPPRQNPW